jgi:hypothetical protein
MDLGRCHKAELEDKKYVIMCDVSGSCSHVATPTLAAAFAMAEDDPERYIIIAHSNGCIRFDPESGFRKGAYGGTESEVIHGVAPMDLLGDGDGYWGQKICLDKIRDQIAGVVAFGDTDAEDLYQDICRSGIPLVWLDHNNSGGYRYRPGRGYCDETVQPGPAQWDQYRYSDWGDLKPLAVYDNVTGAKSAAIALRKIAKEIK